MKYPASEKLEIIRMVERSHLSVRRTLEKIGVSRPTFYRWYDLYQRFGDKGLEDRRSGPGRAWNRIPDGVRQEVLDMALERTELSPRELAVTFIDEKAYFISQASVYRLLKAHDLEAQIDAFVGHYNHRRYHESLKNLTPADVYFGRGQTILLKRERIKRKTIEHRRLQHAKAAA